MKRLSFSHVFPPPPPLDCFHHGSFISHATHSLDLLQDIPVENVPKLSEFLHESGYIDRMLGSISSAYGIDSDTLLVHDHFIVKVVSDSNLSLVSDVIGLICETTKHSIEKKTERAAKRSTTERNTERNTERKRRKTERAVHSFDYSAHFLLTRSRTPHPCTHMHTHTVRARRWPSK